MVVTHFVFLNSIRQVSINLAQAAIFVTMKDIHGQAILDFYIGEKNRHLLLHNSYGDPEDMPVEVFFRDELDFSTLEHLALIESTGKILDIGAGAGAHSLMLQSLGKEVHAIENSLGCVEVMKQSGVNHVIYNDYRLHQEKYDTLLLLMNGLGIVGKLNNVASFLKWTRKLLNEGGSIFVDSSDVAYLYEDGVQKPIGYHGEIRYQYEYEGKKGLPFDWVYVDQNTLLEIVEQQGLHGEILHKDEYGQYLCQISGY